MLSKTGKKMAFLPKRRPRKLPEKLKVRVVHRPPKGPVEFGKKEAPAKAPEVEAERPISIHEAWKSLPLKQKILTLIIICIVTPPIVFSMYWISTGSFPFLGPFALSPARDLTGTWRSSIPGQGLISYGWAPTPDPKDAYYVAHYDVEWNITQSGNIISGPVTLTFVKDAGKYRLTTLPPKTATGVWTGTVEGTKIVINFGDYQLTGSFTSDFITASFYGPEQVKEVPGGPEIIPQNIGWKLSLSRVW
jgi:hypothetical protein